HDTRSFAKSEAAPAIPGAKRIAAADKGPPHSSRPKRARFIGNTGKTASRRTRGRVTGRWAGRRTPPPRATWGPQPRAGRAGAAGRTRYRLTGERSSRRPTRLPDRLA